MDVGDGIRLPLETLLSHNGIPQFRTNPMNYNYTGNDQNHPGYVSVENDENAGKENLSKHYYIPFIRSTQPSQRHMRMQRERTANNRMALTRIR